VRLVLCVIMYEFVLIAFKRPKYELGNATSSHLKWDLQNIIGRMFNYQFISDITYL